MLFCLLFWKIIFASLSVFIHLTFIAFILGLLGLVIVKRNKARPVFLIVLLSVCACYTYLIFRPTWKDETAMKYAGKYELTRYPGCSNCTLELFKDYSYLIYNKSGTKEIGKWKYFDDGDVFYVEFPNGSMLGFDEYSYKIQR